MLAAGATVEGQQRPNGHCLSFTKFTISNVRRRQRMSKVLTKPPPLSLSQMQQPAPLGLKSKAQSNTYSCINLKVPVAA